MRYSSFILILVVVLLTFGCNEPSDPGNECPSGDASCQAKTCSSVTECKTGDGCCPSSCSHATDRDCAAPTDKCGDGVRQTDETCDTRIDPGKEGACETSVSCAAKTTDACHPYIYSGFGCHATCTQGAPIQQCISGDGCCPEGCKGLDDDCPFDAKFGQPCNNSGDCGTDGFCLRERADDNFRGGYCTSKCIGDVCPSGAVCTNFEGTKYCFKECKESGDCRADHYRCSIAQGEASGNCTPVRVTCGLTQCPPMKECVVTPPETEKHCRETGIGTTPIGGACERIADCNNGEAAECLEVPGTTTLVCTQECDATHNCPSGSACTPLDTLGKSYCLKTCTTDGGCSGTPGLSCLENEGTPAVKVCQKILSEIGGRCNSDDECVSKLCLKTSQSGLPGGYCTSHCKGTNKCPTGSVCGTQDKGGTREFTACMKTCDGLQDCRDGYTCSEAGDYKLCWR